MALWSRTDRGFRRVLGSFHGWSLDNARFAQFASIRPLSPQKNCSPPNTLLLVESRRYTILERMGREHGGRGVACNWRIRHKLMLGMGLVVAIMGLLLAGTLKGLASYQATMRTIDGKLVELSEADNLRAAVKDLGDFPSNPQVPGSDLGEKLRLAKEGLKNYQAKLRDSVGGRSGTGDGYQEAEQVKALEQCFEALDQALERWSSPKIVQNGPNFLSEGTPVRKAIDALGRAASDLQNMINNELHDRIRISKTDYKVSFAIVMTTSVLAVLMMAGLLRFFNRSVAHPIRDLELGVGRVAKGDFEYRIEVHSGDEIEDLAKAFNDMTARLREMYRDLAQQVNERSRQLIRSERLAGVGFLAAGVAHEINNPLASIAFCGEALERRLTELFEARKGPAKAAPTDNQEREIVSKYLKMIQDEAFRCKDDHAKASRVQPRRRTAHASRPTSAPSFRWCSTWSSTCRPTRARKSSFRARSKSPPGSMARRSSRSSSTSWSMPWRAWKTAAD